MKSGLLIILAFIVFQCNAASLSSSQSGPWNEVTTWGYADAAAAIADGINLDGSNHIIANDNHNYQINNGDIIDFTGYLPGGVYTDNQIRIFNGTLYSSTDFSPTAQIIPASANASIDIDGNMTVPQIYYQGANTTSSVSINVAGNMTVTALISLGVEVGYDITANNMHVTNYNYGGAAIVKNNDFYTTINITDPAGIVEIDNYADSENSTLTINNGDLQFDDTSADILGNISVNNGDLILPNASSVSIASTADITVNGDVIANTSTVKYIDPAVAGAARITASGNITLSKIIPDADGDGGTLSGNTVTISSFNQASPDLGLYMWIDGPTSFTDVYGHGSIFTYNGDLTVGTYYQTNNGHLNLTAATNDDIIFNNSVNVGSGASIEVHAENIDINGNVSITSSASSFLFYANSNVYLGSGATTVSTGKTLYFKGNVVQQGNVSISQNSGGAIITQGDWNSNGFSTTFNTTNDMFKVEGNAHFDNISGHLNGNASIAILGNAYFGGTAFGSPNDGDIYVSGYAQLVNVEISFRNSANIYLGDYTQTQFTTAIGYNPALYSAGTYDLRDGTVQNNTSGNYFSQNNGRFNHSGGSAIGDITTIGAPYTTPTSFPLPVELVSFSAKQRNDVVELHWVTKSEDNNDYFSVYKSKDGYSFDLLEILPGSGSTSFEQNYTITDNSPIQGYNYYKLQQTDFDGKTKSFPVESVFFNGDSFSLFYAHNQLSLYFEDQDFNKVEIFSLLGRLVFSNVYESIASTEISLNLEKGIYFVSNSNSLDVTTVYKINVR